MAELEKSKRLTESLIWKLQETAYTQFGPEAWAKKGVPFYLTSNPLIAKQFSHVILGYLRDCLSSNAATPIDLTQPIYIFDIGAGSGRLGHLILKHLISMIKQVLPPEVKICYVMTDMVEKNIEFLQSHPLLQTYFDSGELDLAYYHHKESEPLQLLKSKKTLIPEAVVNPIVLVCTYFFDTVPQDLFRIHKGKLEEGRITLTVPDDIEVYSRERLNPEMIMNLESTYDYVPVGSPESYYANSPELNKILVEYRDQFDETPFLFPIGGFESIKYFSELSQGRLLLLAGDQGVSTEEQIRNWGEPEVFRHASFSIAVSYHAIARYFENQGGVGLLTSFPDVKFVVMSGLLGGDSEQYPEMCWAFQEQIDRFEPVDYWRLTGCDPKILQAFSLKQLLLFVKLGNWDPMNFYMYYPYIREKLSSASEPEKNNLQSVIHRVWDNLYPMGSQEGDFVMDLGCLLFEMKKYEDALMFFQRAEGIGGENPTLFTNLGHCCRALGDHAQAQMYFKRAKE